MKAMEKWPASDGIILRYIHGYTAVPGLYLSTKVLSFCSKIT